MKGFRWLLQGEQRRDCMLDPYFRKGIGLLNQYGFSFDLLILPDQLAYAEQLVAAYPEQRFVIDHMAKPQIKQGVIAEWKQAIRRFASHKHVFCKISGLVNEADWEYWEHEDFRPYIDAVVDTFGTKRIMFGSDWPVCLLAATYDQVKDIAEDYFYSFTTAEQADFFGNNAKDFYRLV
jgi:L-fuconolactonase